MNFFSAVAYKMWLQRIEVIACVEGGKRKEGTFDVQGYEFFSISLPPALQFEAVRQTQLLISTHSAAAFTDTYLGEET